MVNNTFSSIGRRLRSARSHLGLTMADLAERTGITLAQIGSYERGDRQIGIEELLTLAKALGRPVTWFLGIADDLTPQEREVLDMYRQADERTKKLVRIVLS